MILWSKHRNAAAMAVCVVINVLIGIFAAEMTIVVPDIRNGTVSHVALPLLVAGASVIVAGWCLTRRWQAYEIRSQRHVWWLDVALAFSAPTAIAITAAAAPTAAGAGVARTAFALMGLVLCSFGFLPPAWVSVPSLAWLVASLTLGRSGEGYDMWAWPADYINPHPLVWGASAALAAVGGALYITGHRPQRWENVH